MNWLIQINSFKSANSNGICFGNVMSLAILAKAKAMFLFYFGTNYECGATEKCHNLKRTEQIVTTLRQQ